MNDPRLLLILGSVALLLILGRALLVGNIHSKYAVTYRDQNPGTFWALWFVLLLPLIPILLVVMRLKHHS
ncbi:MAG: hypothetical protein ACREEB_09705 [Caulobacteraceae bacterium]